MREKKYSTRRFPAFIICLLTMVFLFCAVAPAYSWQNVRDIMLVFKRKLPCAYDVDGACVRAKGYSADIPGTWPWPLTQTPNPNNPGPMSAWAWGSSMPSSWSSLTMPPTASFTNGQRTQVTFGGTGDYIIGPITNNPFYFFVRYHFHPTLGGFTPAQKQVFVDFAWISSALGTFPANHVCPGPVGAGVHTPVINFLINSPPVFPNPTETPEGTPNTSDMLIRNLQFAVSPSKIGGEELSLDNPTVQNLFSSSSDPLRPGPFVITPGNSYQPVLNASIVDPQPGGTTVLCKGTVDDEDGVPQDFLFQFIAEADTPVGYNPQWLIITLICLSVVGGYLIRRKARA